MIQGSMFDVHKSVLFTCKHQTGNIERVNAIKQILCMLVMSCFFIVSSFILQKCENYTFTI